MTADEQLQTEVQKLRDFLGGEPYCVICGNAQGREIAVTMPYGTIKGVRTFVLALKLFASAAWREFGLGS